MGKITDTVKTLLIINVIFFIGSQLLGDVAYEYFALWFVKNPNFQVWQVITHMFMHGGFTHILFNMYALWAFGGPIEQMLGQKRFLFFYFTAGIGAALLHTLVNFYGYQSGVQDLLDAGMNMTQVDNFFLTGEYPKAILDTVPMDTLQSAYEAFTTPAVGASGAIYGILVAFGMMFPNVELFLLFVPVPIKAKYFIPAIILLDLFSGVTGYSLFGGSIAHFAHVGGALFGFLMMYYWKKNQFNDNRWY
ncbi:membrane associated rhomboid family serine protease [Gramella sp. Hel_I_59]|jgi:membrane associated rhomboid family serine protease|uniref:rhomboid family intramembrane serine protease n=1 Tax=unclassified Christiangramia TaxID=2615027 RepID=UPI00115320C5|nr:rhomboid family intramembrane serine protease [Gramella sp. Hel_I_59]TQI71355.1 membrane associated rhomboid family serine protease [Gramella sp. Hel_I_59]